MSLENHKLEYEDSKKVSKTTKAGIRIIDHMPTRKIVGHLMKKHRVGLLAIASVVGWSLQANLDDMVRALV